MAYFYSPFRKKYRPTARKTCAFCSTRTMHQQGIKSGDSYVENGSYRWVINAYPKFEGHTMLVPKRHVTRPGTETAEEVVDREELLGYAVQILAAQYPDSGIEVFLQSGSGSEATVPHLHWHVVPASKNDPFRSFEKLGQFYTIEPGQERVVAFPVTMRHSPQQLLSALSRITSTKRYRR